MKSLRVVSRYLARAQKQGVPPKPSVRTSFILRWDGPRGRKWLIVEAKLGDVSFSSGRRVEGSARAALKDLLTYRTDFGQVFDGMDGPYGLGVAWGADLAPHGGSVLLATPDKLSDALALWGVA